MPSTDKGISLPALGWGPRIGPEPGLNATRDPAVASWRGRRDAPLVGPPSGFRLPVISSRQRRPTTHAVQLEKPKAFMFRPTQFTFVQLLTEEGMEVRPMEPGLAPDHPWQLGVQATEHGPSSPGRTGQVAGSTRRPIPGHEPIDDRERSHDGR
jgi:hypothetical protein